MGSFLFCYQNCPLRGRNSFLRNIFQKINATTALIAVLAVAVVGMGGYIAFGRGTAADTTPAAQPQPMEQNQGVYVKPETLVDRSKNITLPGWGGFTIPAGTTNITQGFEFHNPEENYWYEDWVSIDGTQLEKLVVDSGEATEVDHYLKLAGIQEAVTGVSGYDKECFQVEQNAEGAYTLEAINGGFDGTKTITVTTDSGGQVELSVTCQSECYYISFGLYLADGDELLYQSGLVAPGMYIQQMQMTRALQPGTYDAYVVCQPYLSDQTTQTNRGVVKITLTAG